MVSRTRMGEFRLHPATPTFFFILLLFWGIINLTQSFLTEIGHDEAYYWMYSRHMDWGYFDHPPMIALFIHLGHLIYHGELATRLITVLAQLVTLIILWKLTEEANASRRHIILFFGIAASVVMFQIYGFIATPDSPLLLFTALFLFCWKKFLTQQDTWTMVGLGLSMAALMYSKYHGVLIIAFAILSHFIILSRWRFWAASGLALTLFLPHLIWQYQHDFPSFQYHLVSRSLPFNIKHVINFFPNQLLTFNPFFLGAVFFTMVRSKVKDTFEKSLHWIVIGLLLFFLFTTYRGHVEPHWTIAACIPMIILVFRAAMIHQGLRRYIYRILFPSILLILFVRVALMIDFLPFNTRFHGEKAWAHHLAGIAGDTPVVFRNSYMRPSMYMYYTGREATALNSLYYRKTQYDIWPFEESLYGKEVILITHRNDPWSQKYIFPHGRHEFLHRQHSFFSVQKIKVDFESKGLKIMHVGDSITLHASVYNPYPHPVRFDDPIFPVIWNTTFIKSGNDMTVTPFTVSPVIQSLGPGESKSVILRFEVPDICPRQYMFGITLQAGIIQEAYNSRLEKIDVSVRE